jgi:hypothetical protein
MNHAVRPMDFHDFWSWVHSSKPGEIAEYFVGDAALFRYENRNKKDDKKVAQKLRLLNAAIGAAEQERVHLYQKRMSKSVFLYVAQKRSFR